MRLHYVLNLLRPGEKWIFSTQNIPVHIPIGAGGYDLSWIEAVGTLAGLLCIWLASLEKISNYAFGLINVTLFAIIFFQIQLYASLLLQLFFFAANIYGWYAGLGKTASRRRSCKSAGCRCLKPSPVRGLRGGYRLYDRLY